MNIQQIALITYQNTGKFSGISDVENDKLFQFLIEKGLNVSWQIWDDPSVDWSKFDLIILKSPWDYFDKIDAFYTWLDKLEQLPCRVLNPVETVKWNADKHYLKDIQEKGLQIVPSLWLEKGEQFVPEKAFTELGTDKIIVKPCVSGGAKNTFALDRAEAEVKVAEINELLKEEAFIMQPFVKEIQTKGEWSFIFFNGEYSHTILKTAKAGDFRVQHFFGGTIHTPEPSAASLESAHNIVDHFAQDCLYTRVDGVEIDGQLHLMELELIEPFLFLEMHDGAMDKYYRAILEHLQIEA